MATTNRQWLLASRPEGMPELEDFRLVETDVPTPGDGQFLVRNHYLSVDPYMRGRISGIKSYADPVEVGDLMVGGTTGRVVESKHPDYQEGDVVVGYLGWQDYGVTSGEGCYKFDTSLAPMSTSLGVLGMPGMTAYFALLEIGQPQPGETVFISGAAGAVGSIAGQVAKIKGCRVAGSAGSQEKIDWLTGELGFDAAFNYKEVAPEKMNKQLDVVCPEGIDVYFDNVGGPMTDAVFTRINLKARLIIVGQIDQYNATETPMGPRRLWHLITHRAKAEGFLIFDYADRYEEGMQQMAQWISQGKIRYRETITDGLENAPQAFIGLFSGANIGKQLVRIAAE